MVIEDAPTMDVRAATIALDAVASDVEHLQAIVAVHLLDRRIDGCWERSDTSANLEELATVVASIYASCDDAPGGWQAPNVTLETGVNVILLRRSGQHAVASVFDRSAPLGLARLSSEKIAQAISDQLSVIRRPASKPPSVPPPTQRPSTLPPPPTSEPRGAPSSAPATSAPASPASEPPAQHSMVTEDTADSPGAAPRRAESPPDRVNLNETLIAGQVPRLRVEDTPATPAAATIEPRITMPSAEMGSSPPDSERSVETVHFGRDSAPGDASATDRPEPGDPPERLEEADTDDVAARTIRLLEFLEARAPEPHIVKLRIALRAGLSLVALDHPETLGEDALVLIETAVEDILGIDRSELAEAL